jgi:ankyrin repeat protein
MFRFFVSLLFCVFFANSVIAKDNEVDGLISAISSGGLAYKIHKLANTITPNKRNADGLSPLIHAVNVGNSNAVEDLLNAGYDPDHTDISNEQCLITPLQKAVYNQDHESMRVLLAAGAKASQFHEKYPYMQSAYLDMLHVSKKDFLGNPLKIRTGGVDILFEPLTIAVLNNDVDAVKILSQYIDNLNYELNPQLSKCVFELFPKKASRAQYTATYAALHASDAVFNLFIEDNYDYRVWSENMYGCLTDDCLKKVQNLFPPSVLFAWVNEEDEFGYTPLHGPIANRNALAVEALMKLGADPYKVPKKNKYGPPAAINYHLENGGSLTDAIGRLLQK